MIIGLVLRCAIPVNFEMSFDLYLCRSDGVAITRRNEEVAKQFWLGDGNMAIAGMSLAMERIRSSRSTSFVRI